MHLQQFLTGGDRNYGYLVADDRSRKALVIDPSFNPLSIVEHARNQDYIITYILCTHRHEDHINGNQTIEQYTDIKPLCYGDIEPITTRKIQHNTELPLGDLNIRILHTPGHTPESISIFVGDAVFTGDTLFIGKVGGTYTLTGAQQEYNSLHNILAKLPPKTRIFPGHNYGITAESTIENELATNPFLLQKDFDSFYDLKNNWNQYKLEHGIP